MHKVVLGSIAAIWLIACNTASADEVKNAQAARELLLADDTRVCTNPAVQKAVLTTARQSYAVYLDAGLKPMAFNTVSAIGIRKDIHEINCQAHLEYDQQGYDARLTVQYKVRPGIADDEPFIVEIRDAESIANAIGWHTRVNKVFVKSDVPAGKSEAESEPYDMDQNMIYDEPSIEATVDDDAAGNSVDASLNAAAQSAEALK